MKARKARSTVLSCAVITTLVAGCAPMEESPGPEPEDSVELAATVAFTSTAVAQHSARCVDVFGAQTGNDVNLIQWNCHGGTNQSFTFNPVSGTADTYTIGTFSAGKCVEVSASSTADNARVEQNTCSSGNNQRFRLVPVTVAGT